MRVLSVGNMYPPHHLGGYELVWRSAVEHLRRAGHDVRVLTTDQRFVEAASKREEDPDVHRELRWYWSDHRFPRLGLRERYRLERHNAETLERHLRGFAPDVVTWWAMGGMSLSLIERVRRSGLPAVGFVHDEWMSYGPKVDAWSHAFGRRPLAARLAEWATGVPSRVELGSAARWIFVSDAMRRRACASLPLPDTAVAHSGIDGGLFRPAPDDRRWRGRLLYVGRIDSRKGIDTAVRALGSLPQASLRIVGGGDDAYREELDALAVEAGVAGRVSFEVKDRRELPAVYADADVLLFPVRWEEPWGLVPLEAMAVGTPVVATGAGGSAEYLVHGDNCLIYAPRDDAEALARTVVRLAGDPSLRARLRERGLATAAHHDERAFGAAVLEAVTRAAAP